MIPLNKKKKDEEISNLGDTARKLAEDYVNFNYDTFTEGDTYKSLEKRYDANGQKAMQNTLGQVAARTGGMASSYATSAANQSYNDWMSNLEDAARSLYESERKELGDRYSVANGMYLQARDEQRYIEERDYDRSEDRRIEGKSDAATTIRSLLESGRSPESIDPDLISKSGMPLEYWVSEGYNMDAEEKEKNSQKTLDQYMASLSDGVFVDRQVFADAGGDVAVYDAYKQAYDDAKAKGEAANKATVATSALNALIATNADVDWDSEEIQQLITDSGRNPLEWDALIADAQEKAQADADVKAKADATENILMHISAGNGANTLDRELVVASGKSWDYWQNYEETYKQNYQNVISNGEANAASKFYKVDFEEAANWMAEMDSATTLDEAKDIAALIASATGNWDFADDLQLRWANKHPLS